MRILPIALLLFGTLNANAQINCTFEVIPAICSLANGSVQAMATGGDAPYTYLWEPEPPFGQGMASLTDVFAGSYDLTVIDAMGLEATFNVVVPADLVMPPVGDGTYAGAHEVIGFGVPCEGECNGAMVMPFEMFPGTPPYLFNWSDPGISLQGTAPSGEPVYFGFCAGQSYSYTVYDQFGCMGNSVSFTPPVLEDASHWYVDVITAATCGNSDGVVTMEQVVAWPADLVVTTSSGAVIYSMNTGTGQLTLSGLAADTYTASFSYNNAACNSAFNFTVTESGPGCSSVVGTLYLDSDTDCMVDVGEPGIPYRTLQVDPGAQLLITNGDGTFSGGLDDGSYTLTVIDPMVTPACPQAQPIPFTVSGIITTLDVGASSTSPMDLVVTAVNNAARPGFAHTVWAQITNTGAEASGTVELSCVLDPALGYVGAVPAPTTVNGSTLTWDLPALDAFAQVNVQLFTQVSLQATLGQVVNATFTVANNGAEANTANNSFASARTVTGSYDPNDKTAFTSSGMSATDFVIAEDEWIDYVIRFQNTGTDTAFTVVITDTLEAGLDMASYEQGTASHPFTVSFKPDRVVEWRFANILLPDSNTNEPLSHGAVGFRIRPVGPLLPGTVLSNAADIYFDFNAPIRTNTSTLLVSTATDVVEASDTGILLFPNPAQGRFTVLAKGASLQQVRLLALDGRVVHHHLLRGDRAEVDVRRLALGTYLVQIIDTDGRVVSQRLTVQ
ncbi:MAG: T9SS type A sorting domain-containing protein [Flavobacteriales bacterium]|jgi:uncharacterized repeat protein (TIGR01451 family)|nr:T9SS type A sorting domain-containing protein [Flavobacteriales bacterium]